MGQQEGVLLNCIQIAVRLYLQTKLARGSHDQAHSTSQACSVAVSDNVALGATLEIVVGGEGSSRVSACSPLERAGPINSITTVLGNYRQLLEPKLFQSNAQPQFRLARV